MKNFNFKDFLNKNTKVLAFALVILIFVALGATHQDSSKQTYIERGSVTFSGMKELASKNYIKKVVFNGNTVTAYLNTDVIPDEENLMEYSDSDAVKDVKLSHTKSVYTGYMQDIGTDTSFIGLLDSNGIPYTNISGTTTSLAEIIQTVTGLFMFIVFACLAYSMLAKKNTSSPFSIAKTSGEKPVASQIKFSDVAGQDEAKESLTEVVDILKNPSKYREIGAKVPKGVLLVGPPGTGKTLLAKAVAGEAGVPFFSVSGSDFVEMFVGVGASKVRSIFKKAKECQPSILFIDEIDTIGKQRDGMSSGGHDEREQTLTQLLTEMDGFSGSSVVVLGATNRPEVLDKALTRPGRFDRQVIVNNPDFKGRLDTLKVHASNYKLDPNIDYNKVAKATSGASGSDIANILNEGALVAVRNNHTVITQEDLDKATEIILAGTEKKNKVLSEKDKNTVAYHEVGHALVTGLLKHTAPVQKISIVPRTNGALGYTLNIPEEDVVLRTAQEMYNEVKILLGGRAAEEIQFGEVTTGASNDLERANRILRKMITVYGMGEKLPNFVAEENTAQYLGGQSARVCSDEVYLEIDKMIIDKLNSLYKEVKQMLIDNKEIMDKIATRLLEVETITGEEFEEILKEDK